MANADGFELPGDLYYDPKEHFWVAVEGGRARIGLDALAQRSAGRVKHVQLKPAGGQVIKKRMFGTIEAGKYVGALRAPLGGTIAEVNQRVVGNPALINQDPYGEGWLVVIAPSNLQDDLKDLVHGEAAVQAWLESEVQEYRRKGLLKD